MQFSMAAYDIRRASILLVLALTLLVATTAAVAAASIVFNKPYDCGNGKPEFKVVSCTGGRCDVFWYNQFSPGGGYHSHSPQAAVEVSISAGCHVLRGAAPAGAVTARKPVAGTGGAASGTQVAAAPSAASTGPLYIGRYECYTLNGSTLESAMSENFTLLSGGRYRDSGGGSGSYTFSGGIVQFSGAALDGRKAKYEYYPLTRDTAPKLSFWMPSRSYWGDECDGTK